MSCRSCDLKRIYKLFEEKKRREAEAAELAKKQEEEKVRQAAEEATKRTRKKKEIEKEDLAPETVEPIAEETHEEI